MKLELYKPSTSPGAFGSRNPVDPKRCACGVYTKERFARWCQCGGPAKYDAEIDGQQVKVCHTHRPDVITAREAAKDARAAKERLAWRRRLDRPGDYKDALRQIEAGHNDPRALAREVLMKWNDLKTGETT
jgi:hypothetical protein